MTFVIFDTEYIADKGMKEEGFCGWQNREIIQIAAIKIGDDLEIVDEMNVYITPKLHSKIPQYFVNLTGITDEQMKEEGIAFDKAYKLFKDFVGDNVCYSHGWNFDKENDSDGEVMREMLTTYNMIDDKQPNYKNIAYWFRDKYKENGIKVDMQSSGEIATILGKEDELKQLCLQVHNAFYDVYSILIGLRVLGFVAD
jgi:inhibitor of KinA sporulation pathway (predicted exonuclease)